MIVGLRLINFARGCSSQPTTEPPKMAEWSMVRLDSLAQQSQSNFQPATNSLRMVKMSVVRVGSLAKQSTNI